MSVCLLFLSFFRKQKWPAGIFKVFLCNFLTFLFLKLWKTFFKFSVFQKFQNVMVFFKKTLLEKLPR